MPAIDDLDFRLLDRWQHGFPLVGAPFAAIAAELGCDETTVLAAFRRLQADGHVSRIGAVFAPRRVGASTLAAMRVPPWRLAEVAAVVNGFPGVNHNYEREHEFNLWFVATAASPATLAATLDAIEIACRLPLLRLPLVAEYHIDLGFALDRLHGGHHASPPLHPLRGVSGLAASPQKGGWEDLPPSSSPPTPDEIPAAEDSVSVSKSPPAPLCQRGEKTPAAAVALDAGGQALVAALQDGLPLTPRPYAAIAARLGRPEASVVGRIQSWLDSGVLKRFGVVVRHRELGYTANAMLVHDIPDALVDTIGRRLGDAAGVTLCYRRPRVLPHWRYNLFCMVHGRERAAVEACIAELRAAHGLADYPHAILFSRTRFKQQGARYAEAQAA